MHAQRYSTLQVSISYYWTFLYMSCSVHVICDWFSHEIGLGGWIWWKMAVFYCLYCVATVGYFALSCCAELIHYIYTPYPSSLF